MPRFSVVTPVHRPPGHVLQAAIDSVRAQTLGDWELCLVDDAAGDDPSSAGILRSAAEADPRIRVLTRAESGGIVAASNDALGMARGEFVAFLDHDDVLAPDALRWVAAAIDAAGAATVDYVYTDEDKLDERGAFVSPFHKPAWAPSRFRCQMYTCHLGVLRREVIDRVGGFRPGFDGSQDHDLVLRATEVARQVVHVPKLAYHWRMLSSSAAATGAAKPYAYVAGRQAVEDHLRRTSFPADVVHVDERPGSYRLLPRLSREPLVSIVVPTRGSRRVVHGIEVDLVVNALRSVVERSTYQNYEVVLVADLDTPDASIAELSELLGPRLRVVPFDRPFHFSDKINVGALHAAGEYLLLLNDDVEVIAPDWIEHLLMYGLAPDAGAVGGKLRFSDGRLQHVGIVCHGGLPSHPFYGYPPSHEGYFGSVDLPSEMIAVTGACLLVSREAFDEVGGLSPRFPLNFNDVDFCLKLHLSGRRNVYSPGAELYHYESSTRQASVEGDEIDELVARWGQLMERDPYFNPNLVPSSPSYLVPLPWTLLEEGVDAPDDGEVPFRAVPGPLATSAATSGAAAAGG